MSSSYIAAALIGSAIGVAVFWIAAWLELQFNWGRK